MSAFGRALALGLQRAWLRRGPIAWVLWPLSCVLWVLTTVRRWLYARGCLRQHRVGLPVVVVGNRIAGGAGKTPVTMALLTHLRSRGLSPGVLSRGYGATRPPHRPLLLDEHTEAAVTAEQTGDEPQLIWARTRAPVVVWPKRVEGARALIAAHPEVNILVCDDGLQHLALARDIEILVFDERGVGNGWLLPAGPLRESLHAPASPGLRAPPLVLYNTDQPSTALQGHLSQRTLACPLPHAQWHARQAVGTGRASAQQPDQALPLWPKDALAVAGIAHPQKFFDALRKLGWHGQSLALPDHASFAPLPWPESATHVVLTEKDAVKLAPERIARERPGTQVWVAALDFQPAPEFLQALDAALACLPSPNDH